MHFDIGTKVRVTNGLYADMTGEVRNHTHQGPAISTDKRGRARRVFPDDQADLHLVDLDNPTLESGPYQWFKPGEIERAP